MAPSRLTSAKQLGIAGIVLGAVAWVITLPPVDVRGMAPSIVLVIIACGLGAASALGGERKLGGEAIAVALLALAGAAASAKSSVATVESVFTWSALAAATLRYATPLLFGALGGVISESGGVINVGLEGMMLMGCFWGVYGSDVLGWWGWGLLVAMISGAVLALLHAVFSIHLRADQIVSGMGINFLALGITGYFLEYHYGPNGTPLNISTVPNVKLPLIQHVGFFGGAIGDANLLTWVGLALVPALTFFLFRMRGGLRLRSVGEKPRAADTVGLPVLRIRYLAVDRLRRAGGARRRLPVGRLRRVVQQRHDRRARLHRACGDDLRQVEAMGRALGLPPVRVRERDVGPGFERQSNAGDAVRGAAVRPHARRGRRARGPLAPAGIRRHPLRERVSQWLSRVLP